MAMTDHLDRLTKAASDAQDWADAAREATSKRDDAIRRMSGEGASLRTIANVTKLSHSAIAKILAKSTI